MGRRHRNRHQGRGLGHPIPADHGHHVLAGIERLGLRCPLPLPPVILPLGRPGLVGKPNIRAFRRAEVPPFWRSRALARIRAQQRNRAKRHELRDRRAVPLGKRLQRRRIHLLRRVPRLRRSHRVRQRLVLPARRHQLGTEIENQHGLEHAKPESSCQRRESRLDRPRGIHGRPYLNRRACAWQRESDE